MKLSKKTSCWAFYPVRLVRAAGRCEHLQANTGLGCNNRGSSPRTEEETSPPHVVTVKPHQSLSSSSCTPSREQIQMEEIQSWTVRVMGRGGGSEKHAQSGPLEEKFGGDGGVQGDRGQLI